MLPHTFCFAQQRGASLKESLFCMQEGALPAFFQLGEALAWLLERSSMYNICPNCSADLILDVGLWPDREAKDGQGGSHRCSCVYFCHQCFIDVAHVLLNQVSGSTDELVRSHSFGLCCAELEAIQITSQCSGFGLKEKLFF